MELTDIISSLPEDPKIIVLSGAGLSAASGVPTFRGEDGLWKEHRAEDLATPHAFVKDPVLVWEWYQMRRDIIQKSEPNDAHRTIARLDEGIENFIHITQNVDGLSKRAGGKRIVEVHGNLWRVRCYDDTCTKTTPHELLDRVLPASLPVCLCNTLLRPDVIWFGEPLNAPTLETAIGMSSEADLMIVVGTSGVVNPIAGLPYLTKDNDGYVIEVNPDATPITPLADLHLAEPAESGMEKVASAIGV